ncbi:hypothetical protein JZ751_027154 [Albula glossodonta]|uniref:Uncharacterized protein n=1 Tax=Albula glossodonta TaxID=121402 RepID=A0A8T2NE56_9TELE|nr:hypothetical protein JZ751_027154 [Albula glossodonta]
MCEGSETGICQRDQSIICAVHVQKSQGCEPAGQPYGPVPVACLLRFPSFLCPSGLSVTNVEEVLAEADAKLDGVRMKISQIAEELRGEDLFQFHRAFTPEHALIVNVKVEDIVVRNEISGYCTKLVTKHREK